MTTVPLPTIAATITTAPGFSFAKTLGKIDRMICDPLCSTTLLAGVISSDPMLTARLLSRVNAGHSDEQAIVSSISNAVTKLGLALIQGLVHDTRAIPKSRSRAMAACWGLANATASMAKILKTFCSSTTVRTHIDDEAVHCAGLLHDIGTMMILECFEDDYKAAAGIVGSRDVTMRQALKATLGLSAGGVGMLLATSWQLPPMISACIRYHENPQRAKKHQRMAAIIHISRCLVRSAGFTIPGDTYVEELQPVAMDILGLRIADLEGAIRLFYEDLDDLEIYEGVLA